MHHRIDLVPEGDHWRLMAYGGGLPDNGTDIGTVESIEPGRYRLLTREADAGEMKLAKAEIILQAGSAEELLEIVRQRLRLHRETRADRNSKHVAEFVGAMMNNACWLSEQMDAFPGLADGFARGLATFVHRSVENEHVEEFWEVFLQKTRGYMEAMREEDEAKDGLAEALAGIFSSQDKSTLN